MMIMELIMDSTNDEVFEKNFYHLSYYRIYLEIIEKNDVDVDIHYHI